MARVLIIDDEEVVRDLVAEILSTAGYETATAEDGDAGIAAYRRSPFDVVVTDILMPVKDGLQVISELKGDDPNVRIIATAAMGDEALKEAIRIGANRTLPKPFKIDAMLEDVESLLRGTS